MVVVDETSMVDLILANKLIKAVPLGAHLLLVGDVDPGTLGRRGGGAARPAHREHAAGGPADQDLPAGPAQTAGQQAGRPAAGDGLRRSGRAYLSGGVFDVLSAQA